MQVGLGIIARDENGRTVHEYKHGQFFLFFYFF